MELKKIVSFVLVAVLALSLVAGCGNNVQTSGDGAKISWWVRNYASAYVDNYDEIAGIQEIQNKTGVDIEFIHPIEGQHTEQFNVMIASGEYPDVVTFEWAAYQGGLLRAVEDGVIKNLDPYITKDTMPNFSKLLEDNPEWAKVNKASDGTRNIFHNYVESLEINPYIGPTIRQDWLDKLGLEVPETIDDWYTVLKAFKEQDPNGNGQADEVPYTDDSTWTTNMFAAAFGVSSGAMLNDAGKIEYGSVTDGYKQFLQTMNKWYSEGLLDREYAAQARKNIDYKMTNDISGAYLGFSGSQMGKYIAARGDDGYKLTAAPWPKKDANSPAYCGYANMKQYINVATGTAVTTQNKFVDETIKLIDYFYSDEGRAFMNYGIEGESYTVENGEYKYTDKIMKDPNGKDPVAVLTSYAIPIWGCLPGVMRLDSYDKISRSYPEQSAAAKTWINADMSHLLPSLSFTTEESAVINKNLADVSTCQSEWTSKFIMGTESFDNWDKYISEMKTMGVDKVVEVYQVAYDRYLNS